MNTEATVAKKPSAAGWWAGAGFALACAAFTAVYAVRNGHGGTALIAAEITLGLLFLSYFLLGMERPAAWFRDRIGGRPQRVAIASLALLVVYLIYAVGTGSFWGVWFLKVTLYVALATALAIWARLAGPAPHWIDLAVVLAVWLPIELNLLADVWAWPPGVGAEPLNILLGVSLVVFLMDSFRRLDGIGYRFRPRKSDWTPVFTNFAFIAVLGVPIGLVSGFLVFSPAISGVLPLIGKAIGIFLLTAVPEELLFRGLIQNLLQKWLKKTWLAVLIASVIFGAAHLNNLPFPDLRYFLLATLAGIFYGRAYVQTGRITAPALVHMLVDLTWAEFLT